MMAIWVLPSCGMGGTLTIPELEVVMRELNEAEIAWVSGGLAFQGVDLGGLSRAQIVGMINSAGSEVGIQFDEASINALSEEDLGAFVDFADTEIGASLYENQMALDMQHHPESYSRASPDMNQPYSWAQLNATMDSHPNNTNSHVVVNQAFLNAAAAAAFGNSGGGSVRTEVFDGRLETYRYASDGHFIGSTSVPLGTQPLGGFGYVSGGYGADGWTAGLTKVIGGHTFLYAGLGTPGPSLEGGWTASSDMSGWSPQIGVPIGPGQVTMNPFAPTQQGYNILGFGQVSGQLVYNVDLTQAAANVRINPYASASWFTNAWLHNFYPGVTPYMDRSPQP